MTSAARVRQVRTILGGAVVVRALFWGVVAGASVVVVSAFVDMVVAIPVSARGTLRLASLGGAAATILALLWRDRRVASLERVALWIEERFPSLEFALVTALESGRDALAVGASSTRWTAAAGARAFRAVAWPLVAVVVAALVILGMPRGAVARIGAPHAGDALSRATIGAPSAASRLAPLVATIVPPAYTGLRDSAIDEPSDIRALSGSVVRLRGRGDPRGVVAGVGADSVVASTDGAGWSITLHVASAPTVVRLGDRAFRRLVVIEPIADRAPAVDLVRPARDTVVRTPSGVIPLAADVEDDFSIASAAFEYIVSSGEGETFTFRSGTLGAAQPGRARASIAGELRLGALGLKPGDVVHIRAVARDGNTVTGPGVGASETRTIRVARAGEYDSTAVEAAAPSDEDKSVISERMLITLAEALVRKHDALPRAQFVAESQAIGDDQTRLRRTVGDVVFTRLGGPPSGEEQSGTDVPARARSMQDMLARADSATNMSVDPLDFAGGESPVVAVNKPLLAAYNAMWDASTQLATGEPDRALPPMRRALAAIELARRAERVYLRGAPPPVVIDVAKVRLAGKMADAASSVRPVAAGDSVARRLDERFLRIVDLAARDAPTATDSLLVLRIDALSDNAPFAAALDRAIHALRRGDGGAATAALVTARRTLAGMPIVRDSLARWSGIP